MRRIGEQDEDEAEEKERRDRERKVREEASLREREKEVQRALAPHLRDRDKERQAHQHGEAVQHFTALLTDLVIYFKCKTLAFGTSQSTLESYASNQFHFLKFQLVVRGLLINPTQKNLRIRK